jgi:hypothetical protein
MDTELEQVSQYLDQALIAFSAGQSDDGCRHLQLASAILDTIAVSADTIAIPADIIAVPADTVVAVAAGQTTQDERERTQELVPVGELAFAAAA